MLCTYSTSWGFRWSLLIVTVSSARNACCTMRILRRVFPLLLLRQQLAYPLIPKVRATTRFSTTMASCNAPGNETSGGKCAPCSSLDPSALLSEEEVNRRCPEPWKCATKSLDGDVKITILTRKFTARNFQCSLDSINAIGVIAEREGHHPNLHLTNYREVQVDIWTHKVGGTTENDLLLAKMINEEVKIEYSPKWLREHPEAASTAKRQ